VIVNKSTVPIGSGDWVRMIVLDGVAERQRYSYRLGVFPATAHPEVAADFDVVSRPGVFLREGSAVYDTFNPDRIVLWQQQPSGDRHDERTLHPHHRTALAEIPVPSRCLCWSLTSVRPTKWCKYASNAFLATKN
jgi:UDPglucose 6-dehydrogenase